jgi:hypothetical protein
MMCVMAQSMAKVLLEVLRAIDGLPSEKPERSIADELVARREERLTTARGTEPVQRYGGRTPEEFPRRSGKPKRS